MTERKKNKSVEEETQMERCILDDGFWFILSPNTLFSCVLTKLQTETETFLLFNP